LHFCNGLSTLEDKKCNSSINQLSRIVGDTNSDSWRERGKMRMVKVRRSDFLIPAVRNEIGIGLEVGAF